jgi:hypothetical protein
MCRNHSHITCEITGHLRVGESDMMEVRVSQPLALDLPYGERWIKPPMTALWLPVSMRVPLPASIRQEMEVCFTPLYYTEVSDMMHGSAPGRRPMSATPPGPTAWNGWDTSHLSMEVESDEETDVPW